MIKDENVAINKHCQVVYTYSDEHSNGARETREVTLFDEQDSKTIDVEDQLYITMVRNLMDYSINQKRVMGNLAIAAKIEMLDLSKDYDLNRVLEAARIMCPPKTIDCSPFQEMYKCDECEADFYQEELLNGNDGKEYCKECFDDAEFSVKIPKMKTGFAEQLKQKREFDEATNKNAQDFD